MTLLQNPSLQSRKNPAVVLSSLDGLMGRVWIF